MIALSETQRQNLISKQIIVLLICFKSERKYTNRQLAEKIRFDENYLTRVRNGDVIGGEKLLHALETFLELDNLKKIALLEREIEDKKRDIAVLREQTLEKFYAERQIQAGKLDAQTDGHLNDQPGSVSSSETFGKAVGKALQRAVARAGKRSGRAKRGPTNQKGKPPQPAV